MTLVGLLLLATCVFFALNMGGSGMAPAFGVALGSRLVSRRAAVLLFGTFVFLGALLLGRFVAKTLGEGLVPAGTLDRPTTLVVLASATAALFLANLLRIPQSTVWVTVFAIVAVGLQHGNLRTGTLLTKLVPAWIALPAFSFVLTLAVTRLFYPLRGWNYRLYEHLLKHEWKLRMLVIASSCYVAFAIGGNNVANVVGPLSAARVVEITPGLLAMAPVFGIGSLVFPSPARTVGKDIVPIGLFSATLCNLVVGTLLVVASAAGIPQSLVQVNVASVLAVSLVKDGSYQILRHRTVWRIFVLWLITPLIAGGLTWTLLTLRR